MLSVSASAATAHTWRHDHLGPHPQALVVAIEPSPAPLDELRRLAAAADDGAASRDFLDFQDMLMHSLDDEPALPPPPSPPPPPPRPTGGFEALGVGFCCDEKAGCWAWDDAAALVASIEECAAACAGEDGCEYFSFREGRSCSRFGADAAPCRTVRRAWTGWRSFAKLPPPPMPPSPPPLPPPATKGYEYLGEGFCCDDKEGCWQWDDNATVTMRFEACAASCDQDDRCSYFSFRQSVSCSRFGDEAASCRIKRRHWGGPWHSFVRLPRPPAPPALPAPPAPPPPAAVGYEYLGEGFCCDDKTNCWHWDVSEGIATFEDCALECDADDDCQFFSFRAGHLCSHFGSDATSCRTQRREWRGPWQSFAKLETGAPWPRR